MRFLNIIVIITKLLAIYCIDIFILFILWIKSPSWAVAGNLTYPIVILLVFYFIIYLEAKGTIKCFPTLYGLKYMQQLVSIFQKIDFPIKNPTSYIKIKVNDKPWWKSPMLWSVSINGSRWPFIYYMRRNGITIPVPSGQCNILIMSGVNNKKTLCNIYIGDKQTTVIQFFPYNEDDSRILVESVMEESLSD